MAYENLASGMRALANDYDPSQVTRNNSASSPASTFGQLQAVGTNIAEKNKEEPGRMIESPNWGRIGIMPEVHVTYVEEEAEELRDQEKRSSVKSRGSISTRGSALDVDLTELEALKKELQALQRELAQFEAENIREKRRLQAEKEARIQYEARIRQEADEEWAFRMESIDVEVEMELEKLQADIVKGMLELLYEDDALAPYVDKEDAPLKEQDIFDGWEIIGEEGNGVDESGSVEKLDSAEESEQEETDLTLELSQEEQIAMATKQEQIAVGIEPIEKELTEMPKEDTQAEGEPLGEAQVGKIEEEETEIKGETMVGVKEKMHGILGQDLVNEAKQEERHMKGPVQIPARPTRNHSQVQRLPALKEVRGNAAGKLIVKPAWGAPPKKVTTITPHARGTSRGQPATTYENVTSAPASKPTCPAVAAANNAPRRRSGVVSYPTSFGNKAAPTLATREAFHRRSAVASRTRGPKSEVPATPTGQQKKIKVGADGKWRYADIEISKDVPVLRRHEAKKK